MSNLHTSTPEMISILVPSRGRPESFAEMVRSAVTAACDPSAIEVVVRLDADDQWGEYPDSVDDFGVVTVVGKRNTLSSLWNDCYAEASGDILMHCGDDIRFRTNCWDYMVEEQFDDSEDRLILVYGRDGIADERMATHSFLSREWVEAVGYFAYPSFSSDYTDLFFHTIAERLGRLHFIPELYTEHLHPAVGKAVYDQTHLDRLERDKTDRNVDRWEEAQPDLERAIAVLGGLLDPPIQ